MFPCRVTRGTGKPGEPHQSGCTVFDEGGNLPNEMFFKIYADVAQLAEQRFCKAWVVGSSPSIGLCENRETEKLRN